MGFPLPGVAGSLETEHLVWKPTTDEGQGQDRGPIASVACKGNKRPYSMSFKANLPTTNTTETKTVSGQRSLLRRQLTLRTARRARPLRAGRGRPSGDLEALLALSLAL